MRSHSLELSVLFFMEQGCWVARCLEYDVVGQSSVGGPMEEALESLEVCFVTHVLMNLRDKRDPVYGLRSAPAHVWEKFKTAERLARERPIRIPAELSELPEDVRAAVPEAWQIPRARTREMRVC